LQAGLLLLAIRIGLWLLPFDRLRRYCERPPRTGLKRRPTARTITWAIRTMATYVPRASCLTRALAGKLLLARYGHVAELRFGVAKSPQGVLEAHAWLEQGDAVLLGNLPDLRRYAVLPTLEQVPGKGSYRTSS